MEDLTMPNTIEHERMRWRQMTDAQLRTRLTRITDPVKLAMFIRLADETGARDLANDARAKLNALQAVPVAGNEGPERVIHLQAREEVFESAALNDVARPIAEVARTLHETVTGGARDFGQAIEETIRGVERMAKKMTAEVKKQKEVSMPRVSIEEMIEARRYRMKTDAPDCEGCEKKIPDEDLVDDEFLEMYLSSGLCRECQDKAMADSDPGEGAGNE